MLNRKPLYDELVSRLIQGINTGKLAPTGKLPPEAELAKQLRVSRATLREALGVLTSEGYIHKVHGLGSFVNAKRNVIFSGLESLESYTEAIRRNGYEPRDEMLSVQYGRLDVETALDLDINPDEDCILIESLRRADGVPVIYCRDYLLPHVLDGLDLDLVGSVRLRHESLLGFLEEVGIEVVQGNLQLGAQPAAPEVARMLEIAPGEPILTLTGPTFDSRLCPVYFSENYFWTKRYTFSFVRRKPRSMIVGTGRVKTRGSLERSADG